MATQSRTLKLSILAETKQLADALKGSQKNVESFGDQLTDFGKKAAVAFAAAGAAIGAFAVTSIKNALADEAAQRKLEETLRASTAATDAQIASVGAWIDKTSLAIGVTDQSLQQYLGNPVLGKILVLVAIIGFLQWRPAGLLVTKSRSLEG